MYRIFVVIIIAIVLGSCSMVGIRSGYEQPSYEVVEKISDQLEIRYYGPRLAVETMVESDDYGSGKNAAFRLLFGYISGSNVIQKEINMTAPVESIRVFEKIDMTAPVETVVDKPNMVRMRFFLPGSYNLNNVPEPIDSRVREVMVPEQYFAVLRFSAYAGEEVVADKYSKLLQLLENGAWEISGASSVYGYDPPWTLPFFRRNEVVLLVDSSGVAG